MSFCSLVYLCFALLKFIFIEFILLDFISSNNKVNIVVDILN